MLQVLRHWHGEINFIPANNITTQEVLPFFLTPCIVPIKISKLFTTETTDGEFEKVILHVNWISVENSLVI